LNRHDAKPAKDTFSGSGPGGSENVFLGSLEAPFVPFHSAISHGVLGALAVSNFLIGANSTGVATT
jgi:hypothetical protein